MYVFILCLLMYVFAMAICLIVGFISLSKIRQKKYHNARWITIAAFLTAAMELFYMVNFLDANSPLNRLLIGFSNSIEMVCLDFTLLSFLHYLNYSTKFKQNKASEPLAVALWSLGFIDGILLLVAPVPGLHGVFVQTSDVIFLFAHRPVCSTMISGGIVYYFHYSLAYVLVSLIAASYIYSCVRMPKAYTPRYWTMSFALILFASLSIVQQLVPRRFYMDLTVPFYAVILAAACHLVYNNKPYLMIHKVRNIIFDNLDTPVVMFDYKDVMIDCNNTAKKAFDIKDDDLNFLDQKTFIRENLQGLVKQSAVDFVDEVTMFIPPADRRIYRLDYRVLHEKRKYVGTLLQFNDITQITRMYKSLEDFTNKDEVSGLHSRFMLQKKIAEINLYRRFPYSAVVCEIRNLHILRNGIGEEAANQAVKMTANILQTITGAEDFCAYSNGIIYILLPSGDRDYCASLMKKFAGTFDVENNNEFPVRIDYGIASRTSPDEDMNLTISKAENDMLREKTALSGEQKEVDVIRKLKLILEQSEGEQREHSMRVASVAVSLGRRLNRSEKELDQLKLLAQFHDIGKLSVPDKILDKAGPLSPDEKDTMINHTIRGYAIADAIPELRPIAKDILHHHERWDGKGYPHGLKGEEIPYLARIITIVDSFDVMTHDRYYHKAISEEAALEEIERCSGTQFDPYIAPTFIEMIKRKNEEHIEMLENL